MASAQEIMLMFRGVDNVSPTTDKIKRNVTGIGDSASGIKGKISSIASSFDMVSSSITGVVGGLSLASMATDSWAGATEKQMNQLLLARKYGDETAQTLSDGIKQIVKDTPGDDSFLTSMLSNASLQAEMTTDDLHDMASAIADYNIMSQAGGSSSFETQGEIRNYLMTGETGRMKDTALAPYLDQLENASDVTERVQVLTKALQGLGFAGASELPSAAKSMETFKGTMQQALTSVGEKFLPIVQTILDGFLKLDEMLGGNLSTGLVIVGGGLAALTTGAGVLGATLPAITSGFDIMKGVLFGTQAAEEAMAATTTLSTGAIETQAGVTELLATSQYSAALAEAGLTESEVANMASMYGATTAMESKEVATAALSTENMAAIAAQMGLTEAELSAAVAHAGNIPVLEAEGLAATESSTGFWAMAAAEIASLWPLLAIAAAVAAVIVIVEQIGEALGWWTDFSTMLDAIKDGVMRLWNAFINSPQVQGTLAAIQGAFQSLMSALQPVFNWLTAAWNNLFKSEGAGSGGPDVVRQLIDFFGQLGSVAGDVVNTLVRFGTEVFTALSPIFGLVSSIVFIFTRMWQGQIGIEQGVMMILANVGQIYATIGRLVLQIGQRILTGIVNALRPIPGRIWQFLLQAVLRLVIFRNLAVARAREAGLRILMGIVNFIRQLPGRVGSFMMQVPGRIAQAAGAAVGAAASLASQVVSAVTSGVTGIADKIYTEFMNIPSRINGAVSDAVSAAANFGSGIKDAVLNALHIASPGIIQRKIAIEFADIPGRIGESQDYVYGAARDYAGNILRGFNAPQMSLSNMGVARQNTNYVPIHPSNSNITIVHVHEGAAPIDARNMTKREAQGMITFAFEDIGRNPESYGG